MAMYLKKIPKKFILSLIFYLVSMSLVILENKKMEKKILGAQTQLKINQQTIAYWEQILTERPNYRDGWIQLAAAYYKIGNKQKAKEALQKAKTLDPTYKIILNFEKLIGD